MSTKKLTGMIKTKVRKGLLIDNFCVLRVKSYSIASSNWRSEKSKIEENHQIRKKNQKTKVTLII